jgi:hypothetical protein
MSFKSGYMEQRNPVSPGREQAGPECKKTGSRAVLEFQPSPVVNTP